MFFMSLDLSRGLRFATARDNAVETPLCSLHLAIKS